MEDENRYEVSIKDLAHYIIRKWRITLFCALILAILFGAARLIRGIMTFESQKKTFQTMVDIYEDEHKTYLEDVDDVSVKIEKLQTKIENQKKYNEESLLMNVDADSIMQASADVLFELIPSAQTDELSGGITWNNDPIDSLMKIYSTNILVGIDWNKVGKIIDVEGKYVQDLFYTDIDYDSNIMTLKLSYPDKSDAENMLKEILTQMLDKKDDTVIRSAEYSMVVYSIPTELVTDEMLLSRQNHNNVFYASLEQQLNELIASKETSQEPVWPSGEPTIKHTIIRIIEFVFVGAVAGIIFSWFVLSIFFLNKGIIYSADSMKKITGLRLLGVFPRSYTKHQATRIEHWLDQKEADKILSSDDVIEKIILNVSGYRGKINKIFLTGMIGDEQLCNIAEKMKKGIENVDILTGSNVLVNTESIRLLTQTEGVILVEQRESTMLPELLEEKAYIESFNKQIIGIVVL